MQFVTVDDGVQLEVLDWGGTGRNIPLLAGSSNTAHVFDDFAPKIAHSGHMYGITRRGFGASSRSESGYDDQRLADDVLRVLDESHISKPVLVGHSMAGSEMTTLGSHHSGRIAGLVYLDAGDDPGDYPGDPAYRALFEKLPPSVTRPARPSPKDRRSFQAYREWQARTTRFVFPDAELRQRFNVNDDGSVGPPRAAGSISQKKPVSQMIGEGSTKLPRHEQRRIVNRLRPSFRYHPTPGEDRSHAMSIVHPIGPRMRSATPEYGKKALISRDRARQCRPARLNSRVCWNGSCDAEFTE